MIIRVLLIYTLLIIPRFALSQHSSKAKKALLDATEYFHNDKYLKTLETYSTIEENLDSIPEVNFQKGICYYYLEDEVRALPFLEKALHGGIKQKQVFYSLGHIFHSRYRFKESIQAFESYLALLEPNETFLKKEALQLIARSKMAKEMVDNPVDSIKIHNLGSSVNSKHDDFSPVVSIDELVLIFTSRRENTTGGEKDESEEYYEDTYITYKIGPTWSKAANIRSINTDSHDACVAMSANGEELILYRATPQNNGNLYTSALEGEKWSDPKPLGNKINTSYRETSASLSADGKIILFSSNRKGGYGGLDIYSATKQADGTFGTPVLLGPEINTENDEDCPFLHADGKTLYFSSDGEKSMGGFDIFYCTINPSTGKILAPVLNIGYPINTTTDDVFFVWSADNKRAYFSSERAGGFGKKDIYLLERTSAKANVVMIKGTIVDKQTTKPIYADLKITDSLGIKEFGTFHSNSKSGKYTVVLNEGNTYRLTYTASGYDTCTLFMNLTTEQEYKEFTKDISLTPRSRKVSIELLDASNKKVLHAKIRLMNLDTGDYITVEENDRDGSYSINMNEGNVYTIEINKVGYLIVQEEFKIPTSSSPNQRVSIVLKPVKTGNIITLNHIYYTTGASKPKDGFIAEIDKILNFMHENPTVSLQIAAHTDEIGTDYSNFQLSQQRAEYLLSYIVSKGIAKNRLTAKGFGELSPTKQFAAKKNYALDRRVEFTILSTE